MKRATSYEEYLAAIESIKKQDKTTWFSAGEKALTADEQKLDSYMKKKRDALLGEKKYIYDAYSPALMFHKAKTDIMNNDLFDIFIAIIISKLPGLIQRSLLSRKKDSPLLTRVSMILSTSGTVLTTILLPSRRSLKSGRSIKTTMLPRLNISIKTAMTTLKSERVFPR